MRVLIFGRHGQLGSKLTNIFKRNHKVLSLGHQEVDITDQNVVEQAFVKHKPQYVLNAAANTQVEANESDAFGAYAVNAIGAYYVSLAAHRHKAVVVHISTDYVFDGKRSYYFETDSPSPLNIYGASKLAGEQLVAIANKHHYIVRTSALFGDKQIGSPPNFVDLVISSALNKNNIICKALRLIKKNYKDIGIMCDVALDPYTSHGHDGIIKNNYVDNDETIKILVKQSLLQAEMGCDVIAPSDMMDGRIGEIRKALDKNGHELVQILSYAVKYASNFYGPFRDAVGSKKKLKGDKKNYQMDFKNSKEALREVALDIKEGADFVMVKPGMPYLDIIKLIRDNFEIPVFAYQVSGEYSLIKSGITNRILNEDAIIESLTSFKRAGASAIVTYFADQIANKLR